MPELAGCYSRYVITVYFVGRLLYIYELLIIIIYIYVCPHSHLRSVLARDLEPKACYSGLKANTYVLSFKIYEATKTDQSCQFVANKAHARRTGTQRIFIARYASAGMRRGQHEFIRLTLCQELAHWLPIRTDGFVECSAYPRHFQVSVVLPYMPTIL